jgi:hypothetical protein
MPLNRSYTFELFFKSFFEEVWDRVDPANYWAASQLVGEEKEEAARLLIEAINSANSRCVHDIGRYVRGLGELRSDSAAAALSQILPNTTDFLRFLIAEAIWKTNRSPEVEKIMVGMMHPRPPETYERLTDFLDDEGCRHAAAFALRHLSDDASEFALFEALDDDSPLVRRHAAESLIERNYSKIPESKKIYPRNRPPAETDMVERISSVDAAVRSLARKSIVDYIKPSVAPKPKIPAFPINFFPEATDYVIYREAGREFWFHLWRTKYDLSLFTKDCLDSPNGSAVLLKDAESFRIIPRIYWFLHGNDQYPTLQEEPHPSEQLASIPSEYKKPLGWRSPK